MVKNKTSRENASSVGPVLMEREADRRPTMTDVARLAGVSQSSVSLVLNQMTGARLSEVTRERVVKAAAELGYALPHERRIERQTETKNTIAFIIDEISTSPHPVVSLDGIRDLAWEAGYLVTSHVTRSNKELEQATLDAIFCDPRVVGLIYATIFTREVKLPPLAKDMPIVLLNCYSQDRQQISIVPAEVAGGFNATEYLIKNGHRRIAFINGEPWMDAAAERLKGYRQALATYDIPFDADLVRDGDWLPLKGYHAARELLSAPRLPDAILCANDLMALGAMEAASELGLIVPKDISIMGYDDQELARYTHPPLTTLVLPNYEMGCQAAQTLIDMVIAGKSLRAGLIKIDGPVVARGSVRNLLSADRAQMRAQKN